MLSQHLVNIEEELGVQLLDRSPRGIVLTLTGQILLRHAHEICHIMEICRECVRMSGGVPHCSASMVLSVPLAETVLVELSKVRLRAIEVMSGSIKTWLEQQTIDLAFLHEVDDLKNCHVRKLMSEDLYYFAAADNWPLKTKPGTPVHREEITAMDLILPSQHHGLRQRVDRCPRGLHKALNVIMGMDSLARIKELVVRGSGYTVLALAASPDSVQRGELVSSLTFHPQITWPIYLVRNQTKPSTEASKAVERIAVEVLNDLVKRKILNATDG